MARRRTLQVVVSSLLTECGFESAEKAAVETLTEMMQSCKLKLKTKMGKHDTLGQTHRHKCCQHKCSLGFINTKHPWFT